MSYFNISTLKKRMGAISAYWRRASMVYGKKYLGEYGGVTICFCCKTPTVPVSYPIIKWGQNKHPRLIFVCDCRFGRGICWVEDKCSTHCACPTGPQTSMLLE